MTSRRKLTSVVGALALGGILATPALAGGPLWYGTLSCDWTWDAASSLEVVVAGQEYTRAEWAEARQLWSSNDQCVKGTLSLDVTKVE